MSSVDIVGARVGRALVQVRERPARTAAAGAAVVALAALPFLFLSGGEPDGIALRGCRSTSQLAIQGDGRIVIAGEVFSSAGSGEYLPVLARVGTDGTPDATFGDGGSFTPTPESDAFYWSSGTDVVLQQDGKILLLAQAIWEYSFALGRFLAA